MTTYEIALEKVLETVHCLGFEEKLLGKCAGQICAEDVYSGLNLPARDTSMPDGYAVRSADTRNASRDNPTILRVSATLRAGYLPKNSVEPGTAVRIMTGSVMPDGADCVIRFEDTDEPQNKNGPNCNRVFDVRIFREEKPGANIRPAGSHIRQGMLILPKGTLLGPAQISALASVGKAKVTVIRRPTIAVIATGDELTKLGTSLSPGKSYDCNTPAIKSFIVHCGGLPRLLGIARDSQPLLLARIQKAMALRPDAIITSGGVSKGDFDLVRLVMEEIGQVLFSRIDMGPGASISFGRIDRPSHNGRQQSIPLFALSGPPSGCMINLETLVRPALLKMRGFALTGHHAVEAVAADAAPHRISKTFVRWTSLENINGQYRVTLNPGDQFSLARMATANSIAIIPEATTVNPGDRVQVLPLDWA